MSHHDADAPQPDTQSLLMKRRTFVGASVAVGGAVAGPSGCSTDVGIDPTP